MNSRDFRSDGLDIITVIRHVSYLSGSCLKKKLVSWPLMEIEVCKKLIFWKYQNFKISKNASHYIRFKICCIGAEGDLKSAFSVITDSDSNGTKNGSVTWI